MDCDVHYIKNWGQKLIKFIEFDVGGFPIAINRIKFELLYFCFQ